MIKSPEIRAILLLEGARGRGSNQQHIPFASCKIWTYGQTFPTPINDLCTSHRLSSLEISVAAARAGRVRSCWSDGDSSYLLQWPRLDTLKPYLFVLQRIPWVGLLVE